MEQTMLWVVDLGVVVFLGAFLAVLPRITRRGLLFGVYVGEQVADSAEAQRLTRRWTWGILAWTAVALAAQWVVTALRGAPTVFPTALFVLLAGQSVEYVRSYRAARVLARSAPARAPVAVAYVSASPARKPVLAYLALAVSLSAGLFACGYTWFHLDNLPARMPVHFNGAGLPDGYRPASFVSIWLLPLTALVFGAMIPLLAILVAQAKRAVRQGDGGVSLAAQERSRAAMSNFLAVVAFLTAALLTFLSVGSVRVAIGAARSLPPGGPVIVVVMLGVTFGGIAFLALRFGQGGSRLETTAAHAPLTNGMADNQRWVWGMFYVNRDDPSIFVEHRFGFGYTINLGNPRAVALSVVFLMLTLGLAILPAILR
jgi:uncharacterized membrane protein